MQTLACGGQRSKLMLALRSTHFVGTRLHRWYHHLGPSPSARCARGVPAPKGEIRWAERPAMPGLPKMRSEHGDEADPVGDGRLWRADAVGPYSVCGVAGGVS